jgi:hypothetical protein
MHYGNADAIVAMKLLLGAVPLGKANLGVVAVIKAVS